MFNVGKIIPQLCLECVWMGVYGTVRWKTVQKGHSFARYHIKTGYGYVGNKPEFAHLKDAHQKL